MSLCRGVWATSGLSGATGTSANSAGRPPPTHLHYRCRRPRQSARPVDRSLLTTPAHRGCGPWGQHRLASRCIAAVSLVPDHPRTTVVTGQTCAVRAGRAAESRQRTVVLAPTTRSGVQVCKARYGAMASSVMMSAIWRTRLGSARAIFHPRMTPANSGTPMTRARGQSMLPCSA